MERELQSPMNVVENATTVLTRISSICALMMNMNDDDLMIRAEDVAEVMDYFHHCLDKQIKALDNIQWAQ